LFGERRRPAGNLTGRAHAGHQIAGRQGHADRILIERLAVRADGAGTIFHAAVSQWDIVGDDDIAGLNGIGDPIVSSISALRDDDDFDPRAGVRTNAAVADHDGFQIMALGDLEDLVLDWTGVGIDVNFRHRLRRVYFFGLTVEGWRQLRLCRHNYSTPFGACSAPRARES
jgi:hypothetical protein